MLGISGYPAGFNFLSSEENVKVKLKGCVALKSPAKNKPRIVSFHWPAEAMPLHTKENIQGIPIEMGM